jgi:hypothetical protein
MEQAMNNSNPLKTYNPQAAHVSSSIGAFVNYIGATAEKFAEARAQVFKDFPGCVIVDGSDNWNHHARYRPETFPREPRDFNGEKIGLGIPQPLAWYHSKTSGISKSGMVLSEEQFALLRERYEATYGSTLAANGIRVYREGAE